MIETGYEYAKVAIAKLKGAEYNPREISDESMSALMDSLRQFGFVQPVVARKSDYLIVGGHQRVAAMLAIVAEREADPAKVKVPVVLVHGLDDTQTKVLNLALNKISGDWNYDKLGSLLGGLQAEVPTDDLVVSGFNSFELDSYSLPAEDLNVDAPELPPVEAASKAYKFKLNPKAADIVSAALAKFEGSESERFVALCEAYLAKKENS